jgi:hypothetical protein
MFPLPGSRSRDRSRRWRTSSRSARSRRRRSSSSRQRVSGSSNNAVAPSEGFECTLGHETGGILFPRRTRIQEQRTVRSSRVVYFTAPFSLPMYGWESGRIAPEQIRKPQSQHRVKLCTWYFPRVIWSFDRNRPRSGTQGDKVEMGKDAVAREGRVRLGLEDVHTLTHARTYTHILART